LLPDDIEQVYLSEGEVFVLADVGSAASGLNLRVAGLDLPFSRVDASEKKLEQLANDRIIQTNTEQPIKRIIARDGGETPKASGFVNKLENWTLEGSDTIQVVVVEHERPSEIFFDCETKLAPHDTPLTFKTLIAIHRGNADFRLHVQSETSGRSRVQSTPFDIRKTGGKTSNRYQSISFSIPPTDDAEIVSFSVVYRGSIGDQMEIEPYLFVTMPRIEVASRHPRATTPLSLSGTSQHDPSWFRASYPITEVRAGEEIHVISPKGQAMLFEAERNSVTLQEQIGASLLLAAAEPQRVAFFLNGQPAFNAFIGAESTSVPLPAEFLTGQTYHLTVRDETGSQVLLETYILSPRVLTPVEVLQRESSHPFPGPLFVQAAHRYESLKAHLASPQSAEVQAQLSHVLSILEGGHDNVMLKPLWFPEVEAPDVSIVIPAHNSVEVTYYCLCSLLLAQNNCSFEVIVVDDGSTDETSRLEEIVSGISIVRNEKPQRFIRSCNSGVAQARGDYIVLLNNDTEVTCGWLDALHDAFSRFDQVGLAGAKLVHPSGKLQDAGGIVWGSGNPWNYGRDQSPWDPRFSYARQADYLSGAALMTKKTVWQEVGGFSEYLEPMYFEDADLAFKVREAGYRTFFVPSSVIYHFEGVTSGTDTSLGFKRFQEVNRPKFKKRWVRTYSAFGREGQSPDLEKDRGIAGRVLFIDYTTPRADRDAGSYAALQEIRIVQALGYKVTFLPDNLAYMGHYTDELERDGVEMVYAPFTSSVADFLDQRASEFDAFYITRYNIAEKVIASLRLLAPHAKIIFNNADLHFLRHLRAGLSLGQPEKVAEASEIREHELSVMRSADVVLSYNDVEHSVIQSHTDGQANVVTCPWVVDVPPSVAPMDERAGLSFLGSFGHHPNLECVEWFIREVLPMLGATRPDVVFSIYGSDMPGDLETMKSEQVDPVGFIEDVAEAYDRHRIFVAPLRSGAGIKGKVLNALAHGVPCILTPIAAEGIGLRHNHDCLIASTPEEWLAAIVSLYDNEELWHSLSANARAYVEERFSFRRGVEQMRLAFEAVDMFGW